MADDLGADTVGMCNTRQNPAGFCGIFNARPVIIDGGSPGSAHSSH